jgi:NAD(P)-dependent dehydrogenase (short-subunit alcohol dehydrogenase family)
MQLTTLRHWRKLSSINLDGVFFCVKAQLNHFVQSGTQGTIVNVSSIHGFLAKAGDPAYGEATVLVLSQARRRCVSSTWQLLPSTQSSV